MQPMFFQIKRVHLNLLQVSRALLAQSELTPARFDMMRIIEMHEDGTSQQKLQDLLGVTGATVSRMLKSLEELELVVRERCAWDRRRKIVKVTAWGKKHVSDVRFMLIDSLISHRLAWRTLALDPRVAGPRLTKLEKTLNGMRKVLGDPSPYPDPWRNQPLTPFVVNTLVDGRIAYGEALM